MDIKEEIKSWCDETSTVIDFFAVISPTNIPQHLETDQELIPEITFQFPECPRMGNLEIPQSIATV